MPSPLLSIEDLTIGFGGVVALDGVSFNIYPGEILGLIGPNGAGKTSVFNCITGVYRPDRGRISLDGRPLLRVPPHRIIRHGVARTFQNVELFKSMTVLENVLIGLHTRMRGGPLALLTGALAPPEPERRAVREAMEVLDILGLAGIAHDLAAAKPPPVQKRIEIARSLVSQPRLLLLDEPASGLTHEEVGDVVRLVRQIRDTTAVTVLLVEHHMGMVMELSDRVVVLNFGRKIAEGTPAQIRADPAVIKAYLGERHAGA